MAVVEEVEEAVEGEEDCDHHEDDYVVECVEWFDGYGGL